MTKCLDFCGWSPPDPPWSIASLPPSGALPRSVLLDCLVACVLDVSFHVESSSSPGPSSLWLLLVSRVPDSLCLLSLRSRCLSMKMKILCLKSDLLFDEDCF
ncbi:hypothetical protein NPIL_11401 [Nephila pilipes]|uniref:Uncharacterized protein n=1 Tax=Nephila pilipes TaxID=299642 RepID=A0A8X6NHK4_NEPPI|nr:hypothetical protein NPIL_11401 [Nephila pilipes]